jgi:hypothetical protein
MEISGDGSVLGTAVLGPDGGPDQALTREFQMAAINRGVYIGQDGEIAMATPFTDDDVDEAIEGLEAAVADVAAEMAEGDRA